MVSFIILRMIVAFSSGGLWTTCYVYVMEIVGGNWNTFMGIGLSYPWALAYSILPGIAYLERNWRRLQLIISVPQILITVFYLMMPESPRWHLSQGNVTEASGILRQASKVNKIDRNEDFSNIQVTTASQESSSTSFFDLFKTPNLRKKTLIQYFNWFTISLIYYALTLDSGTLIPGMLVIAFEPQSDFKEKL